MLERVTEQLNYWLSDSYFDEKTKEELLAVRNDEKEIEDRFYKDLAFGTGGLRGVIGAGTNRMNIYTVRKATQGLANYINKNGDPKKGVAISYDSRRMSPEFAKETALCLAANGIKAYLSDTLRPVPEESFALRYFGCQAGVEITASHNPPEYNGYKVYWEDGAQVTPPHDTGIIADVNAVSSYDEVKTMPEKEAAEKGLLVYFGREIDDAYMEALKKQIIHPEVIREMADDIRIVYTPFHGAGLVPVTRVLEELGFKHVYVVPEQKDPDPDFTTLEYPNPEDPKAFTLALKLAKEKDADIVLATDPDADRLGIYAKDAKTGEYIAFTGNMSGMLIGEYILRERTLTHTMPEKPAFVTTIVTTNLAKAIAEKYGCHYVECLTGFKYIGEQIGLLEAEGRPESYLMGFEESYGYLTGTHARDKDGVNAALIICRMCAHYKAQGMTLADALRKCEEKYGAYRNALENHALPGQDGMKKMEAMMTALRNDPPKMVMYLPLTRVQDFETHEDRMMATGEVRPITLPTSNVLKFYYGERITVVVRPSGTEPKLKIYHAVRGDTPLHADELLRGWQEAFARITDELKK